MARKVSYVYQVAEFVVKIEELDWVRFRKTGEEK